MKLSLFDFIDQTMAIYDENRLIYKQTEKQLRHRFEALFWDDKESVVDIFSRVKSRDSLNEKLVRNKFYLDFKDPMDALDHLSDLIGIAIECRFISDEDRVFKMIKTRFHRFDDVYFQSNEDENLYLDLSTPQPQLQRNGFTIYRIDGYYNFEDKKVNFEVQIKSLIHNFWSEIEHEVVYKNTNFIAYDSFMKQMLGTIRDSLDVVDQQLEIVYNQIIDSSKSSLASDPAEFKTFLAKTMNDLVMNKLIDQLGFNLNFKKSASILAQYIYITDFLTGDNSQYRMVEYLEHLDSLKNQDMDFMNELKLESEYKNDDPFCQILGNYFEKVINKDYDWHIFFVMLFAIQPGSNLQDFTEFLKVIKRLIIQDGWFNSLFDKFYPNEKLLLKNELLTTVANCMVEKGKIDIIHEHNLYKLMTQLKSFIEMLDEEYKTYEDYKKDEEYIKDILKRKTISIF